MDTPGSSARRARGALAAAQRREAPRVLRSCSVPAAAPHAVVAIPAKDEAERIGTCLAALATQRDAVGAPLPAGAFEILVLANNCGDDTAAEAQRWAALSPYRTTVLSETTPPARANAGWARKRAMDEAAEMLDGAGQTDGIILTTDADSVVAPTWVAATLVALRDGADAVAGYVDGLPREIVALGPAFVQRGRLEDRYLRLMAEIDALCDPRPHDPWPNHRVSSGASLAVTLTAYRAIGGLPAVPVGEDAALTRALDAHGFRVRHAMDVTVSTSCRFDGRAIGGAADTMRLRHGAPEAPCDDDIVPARAVLRRAAARGRLRALWSGAGGDLRALPLPLDGPGPLAPFEDAWAILVAETPRLQPGAALRPADLPREITRAERLLRLLRRDTPRGPVSLASLGERNPILLPRGPLGRGTRLGPG